MKDIAVIKLGYGQVGFYDELTSIHLTISRNTAVIKSGMNLKNIKNGLKYKVLDIVSGSLDATPTEEIENDIKPVEIPVKETAKTETQNIVTDESKIEEGVEDIKTEPEAKSTKPKKNKKQDEEVKTEE